MSTRFLPGVPGPEIESILNAARGNELATGKFDGLVANDEVLFASCSYRRLLDAWREHTDGRIRAHAQALTARFSP